MGNVATTRARSRVEQQGWGTRLKRGYTEWASMDVSGMEGQRGSASGGDEIIQPRAHRASPCSEGQDDRISGSRKAQGNW